MKILLFANTDWYLYNFRLPLARALCARGFEILLISPPGEYGERLRAEGLRWQPLPMDRRSLNPPARNRWAMLLASIDEAFPLTCPRCGAEMRIIAFINEAVDVRAILEPIGEPAIPPRIAQAREPPEGYGRLCGGRH